MTPSRQDNFNLIYHAMRWEEQPQDEETWQQSFNRLAERIILDLQPSSILDVGCGRGYLAQALRKRGVEAWGIDSPDSSVRAVLPDSQPYCQAASVLNPFPRTHYDLIVCVDVLEHLTSDHVANAILNFSMHGDQVLFSCSPIDFDQIGHINTQTPEFWASAFFGTGFVHDLEFDASFISPWAMLFEKSNIPAEARIPSYERKIWQLAQEITLRRALAVEYKNELTKKEMDLQSWKPAHLQAELDAIRNSTSWQVITRFQRLRERFIPLGSQRESLMHTGFRGIRVMRREGFFGFFVLAYQKLRVKVDLKFTRFWYSFKLRHSDLPDTGESSKIEEIPPVSQVVPHTQNIDIIICVYNALQDVRQCLTSLLEYTTPPYRLILVDDGSDVETAGYLREFADVHQATLLRSEVASGYTRAANRGIQASDAEFLVLLNSDTILTPDWLDRLAAPLLSDPKIGMVGPLSNTASWQSVPKIEDSGDWAANPLPAGLTASGMAELIASSSARLHVDMPLLNGFCLMLRRKLLDQVGLFDEENFGEGYGEEDDLVLRARKLGWKMALADDAYIYHAQSKSYSSDKRHALTTRSQKILRHKHGEQMISQGVHFCQTDPVLEGIRARAQVAFDRQECVKEGMQFSGKNILFVFHIIYTPGGGANVLRCESTALQKMGIKPVFFHLEQHKESYIASYPELALTSIYGRAEDLEFAAQNYNAVIATYNPTVEWLIPLDAKAVHPVLGYYIQGFEPLMYEPGSSRYKSALDSYALIEDMVLMTKTEWTNQQVQQAVGRKCKVLGPSVDIDLYRPRPRITPVWPEAPLRISAMIRPESPYREPLKTMQLLHQAARKYKGEVEISLFGTPADNPAFLDLPHGFAWKMYGVLSPSQVANLLSQSDIFIDYSSHQAMGLTAMEAMACGCAVILPKNGGVGSYATHAQNSLVVDSSSYAEMWEALQRLVEDEKLRNQLRRNAIVDICRYFPERAALNMLKALFS